MYKFNDTPFNGDSKDELREFDNIELGNFAESLADFITTCETPMTIGLQGDWGSGKTSLMNMVKCNIDKKYHIIDLNTWHYSMFRQDEYLGITIIQALINKLIKKFEKQSNTANALNKIKDVLSIGVRSAIAFSKSIEIGVPGASVKYSDVKSNYESAKDDRGIIIENMADVLLRFKEEFIDVIRREVVEKNERIFFFIDDLDRIKPIKAIEVLEALKNFMDVEGCVFVLAVDYEIVQLGITEKFGSDIQKSSGKSFFDKIIQLPFSMPLASYKIDNYISKLLESSKILYNPDKPMEDKDKKFYLTVTESTIGRNPRSIKRAINYAILLEKIRSSNATKENRKSKNDPKLLYAIVCMQIAWPELFEYFVMNPTSNTIKNLEDWDFLEKLPKSRKLFERINPDEVKNNISVYLDEIYGVIDEDSDGQINEDELKPIKEILKLTKLTSDSNISSSENQLENFSKNLQVHCGKRNEQILDFFENYFLKSNWAIDRNIVYQKAGSSYVTIVFNRKQIGSLVSLKTRPLIIRVKENIEQIITRLGDKDTDPYRKIIKEMERSNQTTGIGDTEIDFWQILEVDETKRIEILNNIFHSLTKRYS